LKINKKKFIYLISPNKLTKDFYKNLDQVLKLNKISFFQMRFKKYSFIKKVEIGKKIKKICKKNKVIFLINDDPFLVKKIDADGCHLGQNDMNIVEARKIIEDKIIGITCHNSIKYAKIAIKNKASYLAFGSFFSSKTKKSKFKATTKILNQAKKLSKTNLVAIGGINSSNYKNLLLNNADFLAISSYIWQNKKYKPVEATKNLK